MSVRLVLDRLALKSFSERSNHFHKPATCTLSGHLSSTCHQHIPEPIKTLEHQVAHAVHDNVKQRKLGVNTIQCNEKVI